MASLGFASCSLLSEHEMGIRFHRIGSYDRFNALVREFKDHFPDRYWEKDQWVIPIGQLDGFKWFCNRKGLKIRWSNDGVIKQLSLWEYE